jgi:hypothetical protein
MLTHKKKTIYFYSLWLSIFFFSEIEKNSIFNRAQCRIEKLRNFQCEMLANNNENKGGGKLKSETEHNKHPVKQTQQ